MDVFVKLRKWCPNSTLLAEIKIAITLNQIMAWNRDQIMESFELV